jgi:hypothetical protein
MLRAYPDWMRRECQRGFVAVSDVSIGVCTGAAEVLEDA